MGINDYIRHKKKNKSETEANTQNTQNNQNTVNNSNKDASSYSSPEEAYQAYSKLSQEDLMLELFKVANESRESGELTDEGLDSFYGNIEGMLTPEQKARMQELIQDLKR